MPRKRAPTSETENRIFPTRLRHAMCLCGKNQSKLAKEIGVQRQTISLYATGQSSPDAERIISISNALNVSPNYLLGFSDSPDIQPCAAHELGISNSCVKALKRIKENGLSKSFDCFIRDAELNGNFTDILKCFDELRSLHASTECISTEKTAMLSEIKANALEKEAKATLKTNSVRVVVGDEYEQYLAYRIHALIEELIYLMPKDREGSVK